ncbi:MAG TPA: SPOR domain-containing protein [Polyangia bacterium]|nr:SPOR domain-containing protein [Polyangia bacterium]
MTVRYTAIDTMEAPALLDVDRDADRSVERWREKIEIRLDNRQVFFLFFGSAVVACMLFVLGVMVGKRIESRGQAEAAAPPADPLAALDRVHQPPPGVAAPEPALTFPRTLAGSQAAAPPPKAKPAPRVVVAAPVPKPAVPKPAAAPKPIALKPAAPVLAPAPADPTAAAAPAKGKGKFTLHLSTFATSAEADAFAQRFPGAFVVSAAVPGKGMVYRVRYGNFSSFKEASAAKDGFEKQHNMIALVAAR